MKRLGSIFLILFLISIISQSYAFVKQRHEWWKINLKKLNQERIILKNRGEIERSIYRIIDKEIKSTERVLNIFDRKKRDDPSLVWGLRKFNRNDVKDHIQRFSMPLFSLYYMSYLVSNIDSRENIFFTKEVVQEGIVAIIEREFGEINNDLPRFIVKQDISRNQWEYLSMELLTGRMIKSRSEIYERVRDEIEQRVIGKMVLRNFSMTQSELLNIIKSESLKFLENFDFGKSLAYAYESLEESGCWRGILEKLRHRIENQKRIMALMKSGDIDLSIKRVNLYYNNPNALERKLFTGLSKRYSDACVNKGKTSMDGSYHKSRVRIKRSKMKAVFSDIDRIRRGAISKITGSEGVEFFMGLDRRISGTINKYLKAGYALNKRERGVLNIKKEKVSEESESVQTVMESDLVGAEELFGESLEFLNLYRISSVEYLQWLSSFKRVDRDKIFDLYIERIDRNRKYLGFLRLMVNECNGIAVYDSRSVYKKLAASVRRVNNIFKVIGYSLCIEKRHFPTLAGSYINIIKNKKLQFIEEMGIFKSGIRDSYRLSINRRKEMIRKAGEVEDSLREKIARHEIETLFEFLRDEAALYDSLRYAEDAFAFYILKFEQLRRDARTGNNSDELENVLRLGSVFPVLEDFNSGRVKSEYITRIYLKRRIKNGLSKLQTLLKFYYRKGIIVRIKPETEELIKIGKLIGKRFDVPVSDWVMKESNFADIDKKVVKKLIKIRNNRIWNIRVKGAEDVKENHHETYIKEVGISISIPDGWRNGSIENFERLKGIIRTYRSFDRKAVIYVAQVPGKNKTSKEISEIWLQRMGNEIVKMRWGKKDDFEYFWTLSRDNTKRIMESYSIVNSECGFVVSGITTREKYRFFKSKIESVFKSINIRKNIDSIANR